MSAKRYVVKLTKGERGDLVALIRRGKGKVSAIKRRHARVLLEVDHGRHGPSWPDLRTAEALEIHANTVRAIRERFVLEGLEIQFTPKHGSCLNIAEIELQVLSKQCLDRRIESRVDLAKEVQAWTEHPNASLKTIDWQFRTDEARTNLKRRYPEFES